MKIHALSQFVDRAGHLWSVAIHWMVRHADTFLVFVLAVVLWGIGRYLLSR